MFYEKYRIFTRIFEFLREFSNFYEKFLFFTIKIRKFLKTNDVENGVKNALGRLESLENEILVFKG